MWPWRSRVQIPPLTPFIFFASLLCDSIFVKAVILNQAAPIEDVALHTTDVEVPQAGPGDVLVRVKACGLCRTDLHVIEGDLPQHKLPLIPGHQVIGVVEQMGHEVSGMRPGDRVGVAWLNWTCGSCGFCKSGRENLCARARFTGYDVDGGYAEYLSAPAYFVYRIPESFSDEHAAPLLCGGVIGYRALKLSQVGPGQLLGLYGFGSSAHIVLQLARHLECRVFVFTRSAEHQEMALEMGAEWAGTAADRPPQEMDASIIFAPAGELVPQALSPLRKGGALVLAGVTMSPIPEMPYELLYGERSVRSVANATCRDAMELLDIADQAQIQTQIQTFSLQEASEALRLLKAGKINGSGVFVIS